MPDLASIDAVGLKSRPKMPEAQRRLIAIRKQTPVQVGEEGRSNSFLIEAIRRFSDAVLRPSPFWQPLILLVP